MALHHAKHADDEAAREKQEAEITKLYFTNRQEAHARLRGSMLSVSPTLTATSLHEFYSDLTTGSILSIDDAVHYITHGTHHTYPTFLAAAKAHQHTGAFWHDLGLRTFCACATDRCTLECRQGRQPSPGMFNPHHNIHPDYNFSVITVTWILTQMKMDTGAGPLGCPSKWLHCIPPTQHPLLADFLRWMATHPHQIPDAPLLACLTALPKIPDAAIASKTRGIRCFEPTTRLLLNLESRAVAVAADGRVHGNMNLAYKPGVDGCITVCYIYRAAQQDAWRSKRGVAFASNDQSKCFDRMQLGIQLLHIRLLYQPNADDTSQMHRLHSELMRRSAFRVRLPGRKPAVGPPCHITQSASQGTSTGCDRANDFGETVGRAASRGFRDATNYTYSSAPPDGSEDHLNPEPAALYSDDDNIVVGDHEGTTAQQNALFLAAHLVPHVLESQGQLIDWGKSWILAQHAGRPLPAVYLNRDGKQLRDATSQRVVKALGFFFPTDMTDAHAIHDHLAAALADDASTIANATAKPSIRLAALRDLIGATWRHHLRGAWAPTLKQAAAMQRTLLTCAIRGILAVPRGSPQALTSPLGSPPELLALPIALGGFAFPLFVARKLQRQGGVEQLRIGPAVYIPCLEGFLAAAVSANPQLVQAAIVLARLAGWKLAVWNDPDDPESPRPRYRPPPPSLLRKPEKESTDSVTRAIALAARALTEADITIVSRVDRGPCLLELGGKRATKAAVLAQITSAANMAMQQFVRNHYSQSLPHAHVRTALPTVSHRWIEEPAKQHAEQFRLRARVRLGVANINAYRQPRGANSRRNCAHCGTLETLAHMFAGCDRFRSHYRRRHDDSAEVTLADLTAALDDAGRFSIHRERSLGTVATVPDQAALLRPDAFLIDRTSRSVTAIEFTFPDDANLGRKVREKRSKYELWLTHTPRPDAPILAGIAPPPTRAAPPWRFAHRLRVVAVGAWGTVPQSTVDDLIALGLSLDQAIATLGKVDGILSAANYGIYRQRHANTATAPRAAVPRAPPATP